MPEASGSSKPWLSRVPAGTAGSLVAGLLCAAALVPHVLARTVPSRLDLADFFWPMKAYTAARWASGSIPLWNPLSACGEPWLAQLQSGVLYPPDLVFRLPWPWGPWISILLHAVLAGAGLAAYVRDLGGSRGAAAVGAGLYSASGAFLSLVPVYNNACTAAWLPWVFLAARRAVTGGSGAGLALAAALAFLAGEPALAVAGTLAAVLLALLARREDAPRTRRGPGRALAGLLLAAGLACAAAWPFAELLVRSGRIADVPREEAVARALGTGEIGDLVAPPLAGTTRVPTAGRGGYLISLAGTPLVFLLAAAAGAGFPGRRRLLAGFVLLGLVGLLAALGSRGLLVPALYDAGLLRGVRFPARWFVFTHLALCVAAAAGWDGWLHGRTPADDPEGRRESRAARLSAALAAAALAAAAVCALAGAATRDPWRTAVSGAATVGAGLLLLQVRRSGVTALRTGALLVLVLGPLPLLSGDPLEGSAAAALAAPPRFGPDGLSGGRLFSVGSDPSLLAAFTRPEGRWDDRTPLRAHAILAGYTNLAAGIPSATSASPVRDGRLTRLLGAALEGGDPRVLFGLADVRHLLTPFPARIPAARLAGERDGVRHYRLPAGAGRFFFPRAARIADDAAVAAALRDPAFAYDATAFVASSPMALPPARPARGYAIGSVASEAPEAITIATSCSDPGLLVLTRTWDPGWHASVDGLDAPVLRADLAFLAVPVPAGEHRVSLAFEPASWRVGRFVSLASLLLVGVLWLSTPRRETA